jgi:uncharacterized phosphosugar-binding protein
MTGGTALRTTYRDMLTGLLDRVLDTQAAALDAARDAVADALMADRLVHVAGSGHSHLLAEEVFYRAGGLAAAQAILDEDLMLHRGAERSTRIEREEGRAEGLADRFGIVAGDVVVVASNSGRNAFPVEMALVARDRGARVIALTSLAHSQGVASRHGSGKRLFEVADIVIDTCGTPGDAALTVPGIATPMGPTSTIVGVFVLNALMAEAAAEVAARGGRVDVYRSANSEPAAGEETTEAMVARWRARIAGL